jgi:hypothetical protein
MKFRLINSNSKTMVNSRLFKFMIIVSMIFTVAILSAQQIIVPDSISSKNQAKNQTKAMVKLLKLNEPAAVAIYQINLKYQLQTDSVIAIHAESIYKKEMHALINQNKNRELKTVLTPAQYYTYNQCLENARNALKSHLQKPK